MRSGLRLYTVNRNRKTLNHTHMKKLRNVIAAVVLVSLFTASCSIGDEPSAPPPTAFFLVHASPNAPAVDIYSDFGLYATGLTYGNDTGYFFTSPATYNLKVTPVGTSTVALTQAIQMEANRLYTVFVIDSVSKLKYAVVNDNISSPGVDSAFVRFFHFSPNAPYSDARIFSATDTLKYTGRAFNDQVADTTRFNFKQVKSGNYTLGMALPGSSTNYAEFPGINLQAGKTYTIYLKGFDGGTGAQALGAGTVQHTQ